MKQTLIINFLGGPCSGKSTQAAGLYYRLKMRGFNCELITEKAKEFTWEDNQTALSHQLYVSGHQSYRQERVEGKVDIIITDSPIIIGLIYHKKDKTDPTDSFRQLIVDKFKSKNNINIFLKRLKDYTPVGRNQTEKEAKALDRKNKKVLKDNDIEFVEYDPTPEGLLQIEAAVLEKVANPNHPSRQKVIDYCQNWLNTTDQRDKFTNFYISFRPTYDDLSTPYQKYDIKIATNSKKVLYDEAYHDAVIDLDMELSRKFDSIHYTYSWATVGPDTFKSIKHYHLFDDIVELK